MLIAQALANGLVLGSIYLLMAVGFTLLFGVMRIVNFAHGEFYMIGAFVLFLVYGDTNVPFYVAVLVAALAVGVLGALIERSIIKPLRDDELGCMIVTMGLAIIFKSLALSIFGPSVYGVDAPVKGMMILGPVILPWSRLMIIGGAVVIFLVFWLFVTKTSIGRALRALSMDPEVAELQGISRNRIFPIAFGLGVALAAAAGALMAPVVGISPFTGMVPTIKAFIVVVLGGIGSIPGAAIGGLLLGVVESILSTSLGTAISEILMLGFIIAVLIVRPNGILGRRDREA